MNGLPDEAQRIIDRLAAIDRQNPVLDRSRVERALRDHFQRLGLEPLPVRWVPDFERGYMAAEAANRTAAEAAGWSAAEAAARAAVWSAVEDAGSAAWSAADAAGKAAAWTAAWSAEPAAWSGVLSAVNAVAWSAAELAAWRAARVAAERTARVELSLSGWDSPAWLAQSQAWSDAMSQARLAAESAAREARKAAEHTANRPDAVSRWIGIWLPFLVACEAGLWLFWVLEREVIAVSRPVLRMVDDQLHCADAPAVQWPGGASYYFWRGVWVPEWVVLHPESITMTQIQEERDEGVRRVLLERYGRQRH